MYSECAVITIHTVVMTKSRVRVAMPPKKKKKATSQKANKASGPQNIVITHRQLFPKGSFAKAGGMLGSLLGPKGAALGATAGSMLSRITGVGDYKVKSNSIMTDTTSFSGEVPAFGRTDNSTRIRHREFVTDITVGATPASFTNTAYVISPSNATLFPWLSSLAQNYQQYRIHGMVFVFKSTTSDYSAAGALGKVAMATNYNVRDSNFANMQELENAEFSVSGKPSFSRVHPIECAPNNGTPLVKWVRDAQYDASGGDDRLYDVGKFQFATQGLPASSANATIGELWVTYDIEFYKPIINRLAAAVQYSPVTVPVFDTLGGENSTSLFQVEKTMMTFQPGDNLAGKWEALHKPDAFTRVAPIVIDSAKLSYSANRPTPDVNPSTFPSYWATGTFEYDSGGASGVVQVNVPSKRELRITRPGVWYMSYNLNCSQESSLNGNANLTAGPASAASSTLWTHPAIAYRVCDSNGLTNSDYTIDFLSTGSMLLSHVNMGYKPNSLGDQNQIIPARPPAIPSMKTVQAFSYSKSGNWTAIMYIDPSIVANGRAVCVRFQTPWEETQNALKTGMSPFAYYDGSQYVSNLTVLSATFELGFVNVVNRTYYEPVVQRGLTSDDTEQLKDSIATVEALLPKLKELGIV